MGTLQVVAPETTQTEAVTRREIDLTRYYREARGHEGDDEKVTDTNKYRQATIDDVSRLIDRNTVLLEDGRPSLVYLRIVPNELTRMVRTMLPLVRYGKAPRTQGLNMTSRGFGYTPRVSIRNDYCHTASLGVEHPAIHARICALGAGVDELYREYNPGLHAHHDAQVEQVLPEWRIKDSVFTSGTINANNILPYHHDYGNFKDVWSNMLVFKEQVAGGHLVVPEYDCAFEVADHSLLMFDGQRLLHGVTPMHKLSAKAFRYSMVYYSLKDMWACLPPTEEVHRIQQKRQEREQRRRALDAAQ